MFDSLQKRLSSALKKVRGVTRVSEADVDAVLAEVRTGFLEADVHFRVTKDFLARVRERCLREEVMKSLSPEQQIVKILSDELTHILGGQNRELSFAATPPAVFLLCGLQGSGKTTSAVKLGRHLTKLGKRVALVSVDVQRPAAIEQLAQLAKRENLEIIPSTAQERPIAIAERALKAASDLNAEVLIIDTAGRLQIDDELMTELENLKKLTSPTEILLVIDAMIGQQAVEVAEGFDRRLEISGAVLSKLDGDARGGAALSLVAVTGKPIKFVGTGERSTDFEAFHPDRMASRLLDMGDMLSLLEKAEQVISQEDAMKAAERLGSSGFSFEDFRDQLKMLGRMGSLGGLMKMLPGMGALKDQLESVDTDKEVKRISAMIDSMTVEERRNPDVLNGSRRGRISRGSGIEVAEVNQFVKRFNEARKMMKQFGKMGGMMKGMAGGGGMNPGMGSNPLFKRGGKGFGRKF